VNKKKNIAMYIIMHNKEDSKLFLKKRSNLQNQNQIHLTKEGRVEKRT